MKKFLKVLLMIIIVLLLCVPAIYTNSVFGYLPILVVLFLSVISLIYLLIMKKSITVTANGKDAQATRGDKVLVSLKIENKSILVCSKAKAEIFISDYFGNDDSTTKTIFTLDSKSSTDFDFDITMAHVGVYNAGIRNIYIYGLLGLVSVKIPFENEFSVVVSPKINEMEMLLSDDLLTDSQDAASFAENDGFDYTGVREYALGDSMKKIHWKLSAHTMGYMTKINETGLRSDMGIILDMVTEKCETDEMLYLNDGIIETSASLIELAHKKDIENRMIFLDTDLQTESLEPRTEEDYVELVRNIARITYKPKEDMKDAEALVIEEMQSPSRCANLIVCTSRITDGLLQALINVKNQQRNPILCVIVSPNMSSKEKGAVASKARLLDDFGIPYEVINASI